MRDVVETTLTITRFHRKLQKSLLITLCRNLAHSPGHGGGILESETRELEGVGVAVVVGAGRRRLRNVAISNCN